MNSVSPTSYFLQPHTTKSLQLAAAEILHMKNLVFYLLPYNPL